jgi:hypothetical protein
MFLPEYGRNIHNMVDHCVAIADRERRQRCAKSVIDAMGNLFPHLRDTSDYRHILWDHLAIMSDFKLDIDYPYTIIKKEDLYRKPPKIYYNYTHGFYRHYGKIVEQMIYKSGRIEDPVARHRLIVMLANHMKKSYVLWNRGNVDDNKIFTDLEELSEGRIKLRGSKLRLMDGREILARFGHTNTGGSNHNSNNGRGNNNKKNQPRKNK